MKKKVKEVMNIQTLAILLFIANKSHIFLRNFINHTLGIAVQLRLTSVSGLQFNKLIFVATVIETYPVVIKTELSLNNSTKYLCFVS